MRISFPDKKNYFEKFRKRLVKRRAENKAIREKLIVLMDWAREVGKKIGVETPF